MALGDRALDIYVGFDSAWTDNAKAPGAICAVAFRGDKIHFIAPQLARFADAAAFIEAVGTPDDFMLIALDQPTRVPNLEGGRPAERVAASVISRLGGGVQPARRNGGGASMFGDTAPLWPFLKRLQATEDPYAARSAPNGRHLIEVFPALALPSMVPLIWERGRAAKYNPVTPTYQRGDWPLVCSGASRFADALQVPPVAAWLSQAALIPTPTKSDQDRLDSVLCLLVALHWRLREADASMVIGDLLNGYIVTPVTDPLSDVLRASAAIRGVPVNDPTAAAASNPYVHSTAPEQPSPPRVIGNSLSPRVTPARPAALGARALSPSEVFRVDPGALRILLVTLARAGRLITYGEVAAHFGQPWHQGFGASLKKALNEVGAHNRRRGEPDLMGIVVNKETRMPGDGFFESLGLTRTSATERQAAHQQQMEARKAFGWPDAADGI